MRIYISIATVVSFSLIAMIFFITIQKEEKGLVFDSKHIDLGELDYNTEIKTKFYFTNNFHDTINVKKISADCKCTNTSINKKEIKAGEKGFVEVIFTSSHHSGPENHKILVSTDRAGQEKIMLGISAVIDPKLEIIPRAISFGRVRKVQEANSREVSIVSRFRQSAITMSVSSSNPYIKATLLEKQAAHKREAGRIKIELCGNPPSGQLDGNVVVTTQTEKGIINSSIRVVADILGVVETASY